MCPPTGSAELLMIVYFLLLALQGQTWKSFEERLYVLCSWVLHQPRQFPSEILPDWEKTKHITRMFHYSTTEEEVIVVVSLLATLQDYYVHGACPQINIAFSSFLFSFFAFFFFPLQLGSVLVQAVG